MTTAADLADALEPCPFCGKPAKLNISRCAEDEMMAVVECTGCHAATAVFEDAYAPTAEAITAWNTRTLPHHGGELAREFERFAKAATQGPASAQGWEVCGDGGTIAECDSDTDADFIAFCFNHRAEISSALSGEVRD